MDDKISARLYGQHKNIFFNRNGFPSHSMWLYPTIKTGSIYVWLATALAYQNNQLCWRGHCKFLLNWTWGRSQMEEMAKKRSNLFTASSSRSYDEFWNSDFHCTVQCSKVRMIAFFIARFHLNFKFVNSLPFVYQKRIFLGFITCHKKKEKG